MRVPPSVCLCFFPLVFLSSRVTGACPVSTDLIMRDNVRTTTTCRAVFHRRHHRTLAGSRSARATMAARSSCATRTGQPPSTVMLATSVGHKKPAASGRRCRPWCKREGNTRAAATSTHDTCYVGGRGATSLPAAPRLGKSCYTSPRNCLGDKR